MWWVILIIVIIAAFAVPRFGCAVLGLVGILIVTGTIWYLVVQYQNNLSKGRITANEVELSELVLVPGYGSDSYKLQGRIKNKSSKYTLSDLRIKITMQDCVESKGCEVIGESTAWVLNGVPPGQSRALEQSVYFSNMPKPRGKYEWYYSIAEIKGK